MPIFQLIYRSAYRMGRIDTPLVLLRDIVKVSARRNSEAGVTGYLIFDGKTFAQILEGAAPVVLATFHRIAADPRHRQVMIMQSQNVKTRDFADWAMGGCLRQGRDAAVFDRNGVASLDDPVVTATQLIALAKDLAKQNRPDPGSE
jgi:hypothetical protein